MTVADLLRRLRNRVLGVRRDLVRYAIQPDLELRVYWKALGIGRGPTAALYVARTEALRFDCFGPRGHYHVFVAGDSRRRYFSETAVDEQIERSGRELLQNLRAHLAASADPAIREFRTDPRALEGAVTWMTATMKEYAVIAVPAARRA